MIAIRLVNAMSNVDPVMICFTSGSVLVLYRYEAISTVDVLHDGILCVNAIGLYLC